MHFLIDASLPRSAAVLLRKLGHDATDVRDAGMRDAPDDAIAAYAKRNRLVRTVPRRGPSSNDPGPGFCECSSVPAEIPRGNCGLSAEVPR